MKITQTQLELAHKNYERANKHRNPTMLALVSILRRYKLRNEFDGTLASAKSCLKQAGVVVCPSNPNGPKKNLSKPLKNIS